MRRLNAFSPPNEAVMRVPTHSSAQQVETLQSMESVGRELLNIAVEIGLGRSANIVIRENDEPALVAQ